MVAMPSLVEHSAEALEQPPSASLNLFTKPVAMFHQIHTYTELRRQLHDDLRLQSPEWVQPNGESPMCDFYEARLMELLHSDAKGINWKLQKLDTRAICKLEGEPVNK